MVTQAAAVPAPRPGYGGPNPDAAPLGVGRPTSPPRSAGGMTLGAAPPRRAGGSHITLLQQQQTGNVGWHERAACKGRDTAEFYPAAYNYREQQQLEAQAKRVCAGCPVRVTCLISAIERGDVHGIQGGTSEGERLALIDQARRGRPAYELATTHRGNVA